MRRFVSQPAEQLGSACARYRRHRRGSHGCLDAAAVGESNEWLHRAANGRAGLAPSRGTNRPAAKGRAADRQGEFSPEEKLRRVEAVLFVAREPLSSRKLGQFAGLADGTEARTMVKRLNARYDAAGRAFRVEAIAGGHQLLTRPKFGDWVRRAAHAPAHQRLSSPALETLAVIAYRQPLPRVEIEAIRGVNCGEMLRQLMDRDLVRIGGRSEELGRPYLYATTRRFLQTFGLADLEDLPNAEMFGRAGETASTESHTVPQPGLKSTNPGLAPTNPDVPEEKSDVTITTFSETRSQDQWKRRAASLDGPLSSDPAFAAGGAAVAFDEDEEVEDEEADDADDDDDDDFEDDDDDFDDEDFDDDDFDDDDEEELAEEEFEDEEWEEVGDDEEDDDDDDDEEEDWDEE